MLDAKNRNRPGALLGCAALAVGGALWLMRATRYHPDGLDYAQAVKSGEGLFHPHHLLYAPTAWLLDRGLGLDPITACQLVQLAGWFVLVVAAWRFASRNLDSAAGALAAVALLTAARGTLLYTTWLEVYLPALALAMLAADEAERKHGRWPIAALLLAGAVLYHQLGVLLGLALLLTNPRSLRTWRIVGLAGAITLAVYLTVAGGDPLAFMFRYARAGVPSWGAAQNLASSGWMALGATLWRVVAPLPAVVAAPGAIVVLVALIVGLVAAVVRRVRLGDETRVAAVWLALHLGFVLWWLPTELDLYVIALAPLWMLVVSAMRARPRWFTARLVLPVAALLALVNLSLSVAPNHGGRDRIRLEADAVQAAAPPDAVVITIFEVQQCLIYFHDRSDVREWSAEVRADRLPAPERPVALLNDPPGVGDEPGWAAWKRALGAQRAEPERLTGPYLLYLPRPAP